MTEVAQEKALKPGNARFLISRYMIPLFFLVMIVVFEILKPEYLSFENIKSILVQASMLGIIASGMTIVMMTGGADLSVGSNAGLAAISGLWMVVEKGLSLPVGIAIGLASGTLIGAINGVCISRLGIAPFVATLGTMFLAQGLQYMVSEGGLSISYGFPDAYIFLGNGSIGPVPMPIVIYFLVFAVIYFITERTPLGRYFKATGLNQFSASLSGINIKRYTFLSYVIAGVLASLLGLILGAFQHYISPTLGDSFLMDSLMVALLGKALFEGRLTMQGTAFGAIFLRSFETGLAMLGIPTTVLNVSKGLLLLAILLANLVKERGWRAH